MQDFSTKESNSNITGTIDYATSDGTTINTAKERSEANANEGLRRYQDALRENITAND